MGNHLSSHVTLQYLAITMLTYYGLGAIWQGSSWDEIVLLAKKLESAGVSIINTGIGWHEARIPTIATVRPYLA
jgi:2,4-dienoyl-CoA reductase (NADPH2)